jgi:hypothetical protein
MKKIAYKGVNGHSSGTVFRYLACKVRMATVAERGSAIWVLRSVAMLML